jgi:hypothetical protein
MPSLLGSRASANFSPGTSPPADAPNRSPGYERVPPPRPRGKVRSVETKCGGARAARPSLDSSIRRTGNEDLAALNRDSARRAGTSALFDKLNAWRRNTRDRRGRRNRAGREPAGMRLVRNRAARPSAQRLGSRLRRLPLRAPDLLRTTSRWRSSGSEALRARWRRCAS